RQDDAIATSDDIPGMAVVDLEGSDEEDHPAAAPEGDASPAEAQAEVAQPEVAEAEAPTEATDAETDDDAEAPYVAADHASDTDEDIESVADEDVSEEIRQPRKPRPRRYKIQEVVKVRQIMLVQVVKEERGNKGAALTTYLSLAGRYCVLMPNTARGGGISRKITNAADRKKLKEIANEIVVPEGAGLIIRTAGSQRTKSEIKRDYEYLLRLWEQIRDLTLKSIAPAPIYEEGDLIKRTIRDLYNKDIDEVLVEGEAGYRAAKDFMKMIMPSHAKNVKHYHEGLPLFARFQVESYLAAMFNPTVQLRSGGYIVIGVTEALVAIDVNSGRATKEGSIEDTATKTNLEAAEEVARQLRLRDLAGLIVIDFIDMEERKNNAAVEKRLKDKLKTDRARIQVGRISGFGLMEMSRQRLRPGMLEASTAPCSHCHGTGIIRSDDSLALSVLRQLEEEGTRKRSREVLLKAPVAVVNFLINQKREHVASIEARYGMSVRIEADPIMISPDFTIEKFKTALRTVPDVAFPVVSVDALRMAEIDDDVDDVADEDEEAEDNAADVSSANGTGAEGEPGRKKKRRRRRRRKSGNANGEGVQADDANGDAGAPADAVSEGADVAASSETAEPAEAAPKPKSRSRSRSRTPKAPAADAAVAAEVVTEVAAPVEAEAAPVEATEPPAKPKRTRTSTARTKAKPASDDVAAATEPAAEPDAAPAKPKRAPAKPRTRKAPAKAAVEAAAPASSPAEPVTIAPVADPAPAPAPEPAMVEPAAAAPKPAAEATKPKRKGWWSLGR
ncbi:MAG: Rne/Rng family ribonuclease, partial [Albidovulum sp.]